MATIKFYFDEMMPNPVGQQLIKRGNAVEMAVHVGMVKKDDLKEHLPYAAEHGFVLVTSDQPFAGKVTAILDHSGIVCWLGKTNDFGSMVKALADFAENMMRKVLKDRFFG